MVQDYSCAESPFWIANPFVALTYPEEHPFWSAVEENGCWERLGRQEAEPSLPCSAKGYEETVMDGPGIVSAQLGGNGACEFRTAKGLLNRETSISDITYALHFTATIHGRRLTARVRKRCSTAFL